MSDPIAWMFCVSVVSASFLVGWRMWLERQPVCTAAEFAKVVKQLNQLTADFAEVKQIADSAHSALSMSRIGR